MIRHVTRIRVRYAETDQMRFAYYSRYFEYFEQARTELLRSVGLPYARLEELGYLLPVVEAHATYRRSAGYDDLIEIVTHFREKPVVRVRLDYEVFREGDPEAIVEGYTIHSFLNATTGRPTRAPGVFLDALESHLEKE